MKGSIGRGTRRYPRVAGPKVREHAPGPAGRAALIATSRRHVHRGWDRKEKEKKKERKTNDGRWATKSNSNEGEENP
jgi:hypothetical protein